MSTALLSVSLQVRFCSSKCGTLTGPLSVRITGAFRRRMRCSHHYNRVLCAIVTRHAQISCQGRTDDLPALQEMSFQPYPEAHVNGRIGYLILLRGRDQESGTGPKCPDRGSVLRFLQGIEVMMSVDF